MVIGHFEISKKTTPRALHMNVIRHLVKKLGLYDENNPRNPQKNWFLLIFFKMPFGTIPNQNHFPVFGHCELICPLKSDQMVSMASVCIRTDGEMTFDANFLWPFFIRWPFSARKWPKLAFLSSFHVLDSLSSIVYYKGTNGVHGVSIKLLLSSCNNHRTRGYLEDWRKSRYHDWKGFGREKEGGLSELKKTNFRHFS